MRKPNTEAEVLVLQTELNSRTTERDVARSMLAKKESELAALAERLDQKKSSEISSANATAMLAQRTSQLIATAAKLGAREDELNISNADLARRTQELERKNEELQLAMKQREDFVAALSHDLKNPLIAGSRALEHLINGQVPAEQVPMIHEQLLESHRAMLRMIWNMLDVYRCDSGRLIPRYEPIDVTELLNRCLKEFSFTAREKQLITLFEVAAGLAPVLGDGIMLRRAITNLLDNAIKFSPVEGKIKISAQQKSTEIEIVIADSGPGLSAAQLQHLFSRFSTTPDSEQRNCGTGLGLFLTNQIIHALHGDIRCENVSREWGTQFIISLPCWSQSI